MIEKSEEYDGTAEKTAQSGSECSDLLSDIECSCLIYAARYAHTRNTGAAAQVVSVILSSWHRIPQRVRGQLKREAGSDAICNAHDWAKLFGR